MNVENNECLSLTVFNHRFGFDYFVIQRDTCDIILEISNKIYLSSLKKIIITNKFLVNI